MITLAGIAAKFTAAKGSDLIKNVSEAVDKFVDTKAEKAERDIKLQEMVNNYNLELTKLANESDKQFLADIQNSRDANVKIQESDKSSWLAKNVGYILDLFLGVIWGAVTAFIVAKALKLAGDNIDMTAVLSIYGTITAVFMMTMSFHRGTSKGSEDKSKELRNYRK